jgi:hypothetical protein
MKGEVLDPYTVWCGNPAKLYRRICRPTELKLTRQRYRRR